MKLLSFILLTVICAAVSAVAGEAVDPVKVIEEGGKLIDAINGAANHSTGVGVAVGVGVNFLLNLLKMKTDKDGKTLLDKILPKRFRPLAAAVLGAAAGLGATLATGGTLPVAAGVMLTSGALPVLLHEIMNVTVKGKTKRG